MIDLELFGELDAWVNENDFWKSEAEDWEDIFVPLLEKGFSKKEAFDIVESIIGLAKSEYGA